MFSVPYIFLLLVVSGAAAVPIGISIPERAAGNINDYAAILTFAFPANLVRLASGLGRDAQYK